MRDHADEIAPLDDVRQAFFRPCRDCPANWGDKCPGCAQTFRDEKRLERVRENMGSTGSYPSGHKRL